MEEGDEQRFVDYSGQLADQIESVLSGWVERSVRNRVEASGRTFDAELAASTVAAGERCRDEIAPQGAMEKIFPRPVLLIHGQADRLIAPENSRLIADASPGNVTLWEVPGAAHVQSVFVAGDEYGRRVTDFLREALGSVSTDLPAA